MTNTHATNLRKNLFSYLESAIDYNDVINVNTKKGNAIIISEAEYNGLLETLYLLSDPTMKEKIEAAKYGIKAIVQPGGSIRDEESVQACNEHGISMALTGIRHFKH